MGKKKSTAIYARDVVFENNEESFIKMCYMMNDKITDAVHNEIENLNCNQYIDIDMAISDVQSSIYIALRTEIKDFKNNDKFKRRFYYIIKRELRNMAHDAVSNQLCMDGISDVADYRDTIGFDPLSIDEIEERKFVSDLVIRFQDAVLENDNRYKIGCSTLRPREMQALAYNLGFMECGELSYVQIGHKFNISKETVRQDFQRALRKLRRAVSYLAKYKWYFVGTYIDEPKYHKNDQPRRNDGNQKIVQDVAVSHPYFKSRSETHIDISPVDAWDDNHSIFRVPDECRVIQEFTGDNKLPPIDDYDGITIIRDVDEFGNATKYVRFDTSKFFAYHITFNSVRCNSLHYDPRRSKRAVFIRSIKDDAMSLVFYIDKTGQFLLTYVPPYHIRFEVRKIEDMYSVRAVAYRLSGSYVKSQHPNDFYDKYIDPSPYRSIVQLYGRALFMSDEVIMKNPPDYSGKDEHWMRPMYDSMVDKVIDHQQHNWISN